MSLDDRGGDSTCCKSLARELPIEGTIKEVSIHLPSSASFIQFLVLQLLVTSESLIITEKVIILNIDGFLDFDKGNKRYPNRTD